MQVQKQLQIQQISPFMPFSYLLSGGVSLRALVPGHLYKLVRNLESKLDPKKWAMFAFIELQRR